MTKKSYILKNPSQLGHKIINRGSLEKTIQKTSINKQADSALCLHQNKVNKGNISDRNEYVKLLAGKAYWKAYWAAWDDATTQIQQTNVEELSTPITDNLDSQELGSNSLICTESLDDF
ncbi:MAG: hypothetical protein H6909_00785 [Rickettsiaceae bacterium]|nr:hypothetical protein [Rickettsiaceae bacterium]